MRLYSVLYYTSNLKKYQPFVSSTKRSLVSAAYRGTQVQLLDSFRDSRQLFSCISDLGQYLEQYSANLSDLTIIIDCDDIDRAGTGDSKMLCALILEYPEVKFLFDANPCHILFTGESVHSFPDSFTTDLCQSCLFELDHCISEDDCIAPAFSKNLLSDDGELFNHLRQILSIDNEPLPPSQELIKRIRESKPSIARALAIRFVDFEKLIIPEKNEKFFLNIVYTRDNLFDAFNLRYAIRQWKYVSLRVKDRNFSAIQNSRRDNLALSVEEENAQNRFNSSCLYANGFRVMPIVCAADLKYYNERTDCSPAIVIRDYDLQFFDAGDVVSSEDEDQPDRSIREIRGFRDYKNGKAEWETCLSESCCWSSFYRGFFQQDICGKRFFLTKDCTTVPVYFISKGTGLVSIVKPRFFSRVGSLFLDAERISHFYVKRKGKYRLFLPGILKSVSGIYAPFFDIPEVQQRFKASRLHKRGYFITSREGHHHGTSLDIYSSVKSILRRARKYYESGKYVHAAVLSFDAMEYLNGFHQALMIEAYYINAVAENAIAMDAMVRESQLKKDSALRVEKIKEDVMRIYSRAGSSMIRTRKLARNALNQIYSDCRVFCREKEHFESESVFIGAMGRLNEGSFLNKLFNV